MKGLVFRQALSPKIILTVGRIGYEIDTRVGFAEGELTDPSYGLGDLHDDLYFADTARKFLHTAAFFTGSVSRSGAIHAFVMPRQEFSRGLSIRHLRQSNLASMQ